MYMNHLSYPNDLQQDVDRWVVKFTECIRCMQLGVCQHTYPISNADADLYTQMFM